MLHGADEDLLNELSLRSSVVHYAYLKNGQKLNEEDKILCQDKERFVKLNKALSVCEFSEETRLSLYQVVSAILHLGNIKFKNNASSMKEDTDTVDPDSEDSLENFCKVNRKNLKWRK